MQQTKPINRILTIPFTTCGELLNPIKPTIYIGSLQKGKKFQFTDDKDCVREVVDFQDDIVLLKTLGDASDLEFYKAHYSHLKKNETRLEHLK